MKIYANEIQVAEREDVTYTVMQNTWSIDPAKAGRYVAEIHYRPENRRWFSEYVGNKNGYKTERGAMNAVKKHAATRIKTGTGSAATLVF